MKKIWSIVLAVVLLMTTFAAVPVSAAELSLENIAISTNVYDVTCTVETTKQGTMTALLTNKYEDGASANLHGILSNRNPESIKDGSGNVIGYKYVFNFNMLEEDVTGTYVVTIGFKEETLSKEFAYASIDDKVTFYDTLNSKAAGDIKGYFVANPLLVPVDLSVYNNLTGDPYDKVNAQIADLSLATGVVSGDSQETKLSKLTPVDTLFTTRFAELMSVATIVTTTEENWPALVTRLMGDDTFDSYYYDEENVETAVITAAEVYEKFQAEAAQMTEYTVSEAATTFDKATLAYIEEARSVGVLKDAFMYFVQANVITPDMTDINALINAGKDADLWNDLRLANNTDCDSIVENAESIAQTMVENGALSGGGAGGGFGGGGTGGSPISRPTGAAGGGSLGGSISGNTGSDVTEDPKPETPDGVFSDIDSVEWAKESIEALAEAGVLSGKGDGKFAPNDNVTREEFVKIIVAAFELTDEEAECDFSDVSKDGWSYPYIAAANKLGIVTGDGTAFNPTSGISRQDMAVIIHRVFEHLELKVEGEKITFDDGGEISDYAKAAVDALTAAGIINGMGDGTFAPNGTVTRAQAAKVVYGLLNLVGGGK